MPDYEVTLSEGGAPNCAGIYTEHVEYNGQMSYTCINEAGTWYLWYQLVSGRYPMWRITEVLGVIGSLGWGAVGAIVGEKVAYGTATATATIAEYVPEEESSGSSESSPSSSSSSASSSQSPGTIGLPRSCTITVTGSFSFTAVVEKPT